MRLNQLFEDVSTDQSNLRIAEQAWSEFKEEVYGHLVLLDLDKFEAFEESFINLIQKLSRYNLNVIYKDIPVKVNFMDSASSRGAAGRLRTTSIDHGNDHIDYRYSIELYYNRNNQIDLISMADFYNTLDEMFEDVFIHEFTHFLDDFRSHNRPNYIKTKRDLISQGKYVDTPHEFNAFYMQMMKGIQRAFENRHVIEVFKENPDYESFVSLIRIETDAGRQLSELEGKFKKAFHKRLFQLYKEYYRNYVEV